MNLPPIFFGGGALVPQEPQRPSVKNAIRAGERTDTSWRFELDETAWYELVERLRDDDEAVFLGLWCDGQAVHALFSDGDPGAESVLRPLMASHRLDGSRYRGLSGVYPAAAPFERMIRDLWGVEAMDVSDARPLVDQGAWTVTAPLSARPVPASVRSDMYDFPAPDSVVAERGMLFSRGPATGGGEGPVHCRLGVAGESVRSIDILTGFAHRGLETRMAGTTLPRAAELAGRISAGSTIAHQWAFSAAVENALGIEVSQAAEHVRAILCEIERIGTHLTWLARTAKAVGADPVAARLFKARERLMRVCAETLGRRVLMDCIIPGGVTLGLSGNDRLPDEQVAEALLALCEEGAALGATDLEEARALWMATGLMSSVLTGHGVVPRALATAFSLSGPVGRACGRGADFRQSMHAYGAVRIRTPVATGGDAATRSRIRFDDIAESLRIVPALGELLKGGDGGLELVRSLGDMAANRWEGYAAVEGPHGLVCHVVVLSGGRVERTFLADPAAVLHMTQETVLPGCDHQGFDAIRCSFGVSAAAVDL